MVELLSVSKNDESFQAIKNVIVQNVDSILNCASSAIANSDVERAEQFSRIFSAIASAHTSQIVESGSTQILDILVKLLNGVSELSCRT